MENRWVNSQENAIRKAQEWTTQGVYVSQSTINERIRAVEWYRFTPEELKLYLEIQQEALAKAKNGAGALTPEQLAELKKIDQEAFMKANHYH